jgi:hypothetical protein
MRVFRRRKPRRAAEAIIKEGFRRRRLVPEAFG